jgi:hypothetical protein
MSKKLMNKTHVPNAAGSSHSPARKRVKDKICYLLLLLLLALGLLMYAACSSPLAKNLVQNGSFEEITDGKPAHWQTVSWLKNEESARFEVEHGNAFDGNNYVTIFSSKPNHARYLQTIAVAENSCYLISCHIRTNNVVKIDKAKGANINIEARLETSAQFFETTEAWQYAELYVRTGKEIRELTIALALGGYYADTSGKAAFDSVSMVKLTGAAANKLPKGAAVCHLGLAEPAAQKELPLKNEITATPASGRAVMYWLFLVIILFLLTRIIYYTRKKWAGFFRQIFSLLSNRRGNTGLTLLNRIRHRKVNRKSIKTDTLNG